jgi:hypothetical protein
LQIWELVQVRALRNAQGWPEVDVNMQQRGEVKCVA